MKFPSSLKKLLHAIRSAEILYEEGELDSASSRAYYALCFISPKRCCCKTEKFVSKNIPLSIHFLVKNWPRPVKWIPSSIVGSLTPSIKKNQREDYDVESLIDEQDVEGDDRARKRICVFCEHSTLHCSKGKIGSPFSFSIAKLNPT